MRGRSNRSYIAPTALFLAFILLFLTCVSVPFAQEIRLFTLTDRRSGGAIRFGLWGYCLPTYVHGFPPCTMPELGWTFDHIPTLTGLENTMSSRLTGSLVIHPIVTALVFVIFVLASAFVFKLSVQRKIMAKFRRKPSVAVVPATLTFVAAVFATAAFGIDAFVVVNAKVYVSQATGTARNMKAHTGAIAWLSFIAAIILWANSIALFWLPAERSDRPTARESMDDRRTVYDSDASSRRGDSYARSVRSSYTRKQSDYSVHSRAVSTYDNRTDDEQRSVGTYDERSRRSASHSVTPAASEGEEYEDRSDKGKLGFLAACCPCLKRNKEKEDEGEDIELDSMGRSGSTRPASEYRPSSDDLRRRRSRSSTAVDYVTDPDKDYDSVDDDVSQYSAGSARNVSDGRESQYAVSRNPSAVYANSEPFDEDYSRGRSSPRAVTEDASHYSDNIEEEYSNDRAVSPQRSFEEDVVEDDTRDYDAPQSDTEYVTDDRYTNDPENISRESDYYEPESRGVTDDAAEDSVFEEEPAPIDMSRERSDAVYESELARSSPDDLGSDDAYVTEQERTLDTEHYSDTVGPEEYSDRGTSEIELEEDVHTSSEGPYVDEEQEREPSVYSRDGMDDGDAYVTEEERPEHYSDASGPELYSDRGLSEAGSEGDNGPGTEEFYVEREAESEPPEYSRDDLDDGDAYITEQECSLETEYNSEVPGEEPLSDRGLSEAGPEEDVYTSSEAAQEPEQEPSVYSQGDLDDDDAYATEQERPVDSELYSDAPGPDDTYSDRGLSEVGPDEDVRATSAIPEDEEVGSEPAVYSQGDLDDGDAYVTEQDRPVDTDYYSEAPGPESPAPEPLSDRGLSEAGPEEDIRTGSEEPYVEGEVESEPPEYSRDDLDDGDAYITDQERSLETEYNSEAAGDEPLSDRGLSDAGPEEGVYTGSEVEEEPEPEPSVHSQDGLDDDDAYITEQERPVDSEYYSDAPGPDDTYSDRGLSEVGPDEDVRATSAIPEDEEVTSEPAVYSQDGVDDGDAYVTEQERPVDSDYYSEAPVPESPEPEPLSDRGLSEEGLEDDLRAGSEEPATEGEAESEPMVSVHDDLESGDAYVTEEERPGYYSDTPEPEPQSDRGISQADPDEGVHIGSEVSHVDEEPVSDSGVYSREDVDDVDDYITEQESPIDADYDSEAPGTVSPGPNSDLDRDLSEVAPDEDVRAASVMPEDEEPVSEAPTYSRDDLDDDAYVTEQEQSIDTENYSDVPEADSYSNRDVSEAGPEDARTGSAMLEDEEVVSEPGVYSRDDLDDVDAYATEQERPDDTEYYSETQGPASYSDRGISQAASGEDTRAASGMPIVNEEPASEPSAHSRDGSYASGEESPEYNSDTPVLASSVDSVLTQAGSEKDVRSASEVPVGNEELVSEPSANSRDLTGDVSYVTEEDGLADTEHYSDTLGPQSGSDGDLSGASSEEDIRAGSEVPIINEEPVSEPSAHSRGGSGVSGEESPEYYSETPGLVSPLDSDSTQSGSEKDVSSASEAPIGNEEPVSEPSRELEFGYTSVTEEERPKHYSDDAGSEPYSDRGLSAEDPEDDVRAGSDVHIVNEEPESEPSAHSRDGSYASGEESPEYCSETPGPATSSDRGLSQVGSEEVVPSASEVPFISEEPVSGTSVHSRDLTRDGSYVTEDEHPEYYSETPGLASSSDRGLSPVGSEESVRAASKNSIVNEEPASEPSVYSRDLTSDVTVYDTEDEHPERHSDTPAPESSLSGDLLEVGPEEDGRASSKMSIVNEEQVSEPSAHSRGGSYVSGEESPEYYSETPGLASSSDRELTQAGSQEDVHTSSEIQEEAEPEPSVNSRDLIGGVYDTEDEHLENYSDAPGQESHSDRSLSQAGSEEDVRATSELPVVNEEPASGPSNHSRDITRDGSYVVGEDGPVDAEYYSETPGPASRSDSGWSQGPPTEDARAASAISEDGVISDIDGHRTGTGDSDYPNSTGDRRQTTGNSAYDPLSSERYSSEERVSGRYPSQSDEFLRGSPEYLSNGPDIANSNYSDSYRPYDDDARSRRTGVSDYEPRTSAGPSYLDESFAGRSPSQSRDSLEESVIDRQPSLGGISLEDRMSDGTNYGGSGSPHDREPMQFSQTDAGSRFGSEYSADDQPSPVPYTYTESEREGEGREGSLTPGLMSYDKRSGHDAFEPSPDSGFRDRSSLRYTRPLSRPYSDAPSYENRSGSLSPPLYSQRSSEGYDPVPGSPVYSNTDRYSGGVSPGVASRLSPEYGSGYNGRQTLASSPVRLASNEGSGHEPMGMSNRSYSPSGVPYYDNDSAQRSDDYVSGGRAPSSPYTERFSPGPVPQRSTSPYYGNDYSGNNPYRYEPSYRRESSRGLMPDRRTPEYFSDRRGSANSGYPDSDYRYSSGARSWRSGSLAPEPMSPTRDYSSDGRFFRGSPVRSGDGHIPEQSYFGSEGSNYVPDRRSPEYDDTGRLGSTYDNSDYGYVPDDRRQASASYEPISPRRYSSRDRVGANYPYRSAENSGRSPEYLSDGPGIANSNYRNSYYPYDDDVRSRRTGDFAYEPSTSAGPYYPDERIAGRSPNQSADYLEGSDQGYLTSDGERFAAGPGVVSEEGYGPSYVPNRRSSPYYSDGPGFANENYRDSEYPYPAGTGSLNQGPQYQEESYPTDPEPVYDRESGPIYVPDDRRTSEYYPGPPEGNAAYPDSDIPYGANTDRTPTEDDYRPVESPERYYPSDGIDGYSPNQSADFVEPVGQRIASSNSLSGSDGFIPGEGDGVQDDAIDDGASPRYSDFRDSLVRPRRDSKDFSDDGGPVTSPIFPIRGSSLGDTIYSYPETGQGGIDHPDSNAIDESVPLETGAVEKESEQPNGDREDESPDDDIPRICEYCGAYIYA